MSGFSETWWADHDSDGVTLRAFTHKQRISSLNLSFMQIHILQWLDLFRWSNRFLSILHFWCSFYCSKEEHSTGFQELGQRITRDPICMELICIPSSFIINMFWLCQYLRRFLVDTIKIVLQYIKTTSRSLITFHFNQLSLDASLWSLDTIYVKLTGSLLICRLWWSYNRWVFLLLF